jgi:oxygen-independent coproporphyrinogen-3 oxidase
VDNPVSVPLTQFINSQETRQPRTCQDGHNLTAEGWIGSIDKVQGAYIHVPFCFHKCHYCDFFSIAGADDRHEAFVDRLVSELTFVGSMMDTPLQTIFIGGGTPTLLEPSLLTRLLRAVKKNLPMQEDCEWTVEANPETVTSEVADVLASNGVNRVSIGAQSFNLLNLKTLERWHDPESVPRAIAHFVDAGIDNYNVDLIYSIPNQTIEQVESDLRIAVDLKPKHLSCYSLIYEPNTPLRTRLDRGEIIRVDQDVEADMFEVVRATLKDANYDHYEISNFSRSGFECAHNLLYWKNNNWWPFGPAAAGHVDGRRWRNIPRLSEYFRLEGLPPIEDVETLDSDKRAGEAFMLGLRILEGIDRSRVEFLIDQSVESWRKSVIDGHIDENLLHWKNNNLALTETGILVADTVISSLLMHDDVITDTSE